MPQEFYPTIEKCILCRDYSLNYSRVILPLKVFLEPDFFNEYIKKGNILMLSEGRIGTENVYLLREGKLKLHLDKKSYETAGLVGKPDNLRAGKDIKNRWIVEIDFRQPSMHHGKKGFNRIVYAFEKVLVCPVTWLFCNLNSNSKSILQPYFGLTIFAVPTPNPLDKYFPIKKTVEPRITFDKIVNLPSLQPPLEKIPGFGTDFYYYAMEIHEWFSLVMLNSPRVDADDKIDPALSRYSPPEDTTVTRLVKIIWQGFMSPISAHKLFVDILFVARKEFWFTINFAGFPMEIFAQCKDCMILKIADTSKEYVMWET